MAPPPLQPPDWIRSRIRRLFLVSLGVPVDLDEILDPRKKQKKLVLPSIHQHRTGSSSRHRSRGPAGGGGSARNSTDSQRGTVSRLKKEESADSAAGKRSSSHGPPGRSSTWGPSGAPGSSASASASGRSPSPRPSTSTGRPKPPEPDLDMVSARRLCATTDEALQGMTDDELRQHVAELQRLEELAAEALEYWRARADEQIGEREAFEGVIENLVKHARKVRK